MRWNDYVGTAAADDADALLNRRSLYELARLDRDQWTVVALDFSLGTSTDSLVVYATRRSSGQGPQSEAESVPVTAFHLDGSVQLEEFLAQAFQRVSVRLLSSSLSDRHLVVDAHARPDATA